MPKNGAEIDELIKRLKTDRANSVGGGTSEEEIRRLEEDLRLKLPPSYVQFLRSFDGGEFGFARMHAITDAGAGWFDFRLELREFFEDNPMMGVRNLVPFARSYGSDIYCFDLKHAKNDEPPIVMFDGEGDDEQELIREADTFTDWIANHYKNCDKEQHSATIYVASERELESLDESVELMQVEREESMAARCYMEDAPDHIYFLNYTDLGAVSKFAERVLNQTESPLDVFLFDQMEMNSHPKYKRVLGTLEILGKNIELKAGDYVRVSPDGDIEVIPPKPLANHVKRPASSGGQLTCSFCGRPQDEVRRLIAGPGIYICDSCVELCNEICNAEDDPMPVDKG
jgi:hypothetical protein